MLIDEERVRMQVRMQGHMRLQISGRISVEQFQLRVANDLKLSAIRMASFAAGGMDKMDAKRYGKVGAFLRNQYKFLARFGEDIESGVLSERQLLARAKLYGSAAKTMFFQAEKETKKKERFNQARRDLDPQANHCASCLSYAVGWRPIEEVVEPGVRCECNHNCRCRITYRRYYA